MKIAFLTSEYPHPNTGPSGGIGTSIRNLGLGLSKLGQNVIIYVYGQRTDNEFIDEGLTVVQIRNIKIKGISWYLTRKKIQNIINKHISERGLQLVEAPDWTGITAFMKIECPVVIKLHGSDTYFCHLESRPVKRWNYFLERKALKNADAHISVSSYTASLTNIIFNQNINYKIIPNSIRIYEGNRSDEEDGSLSREKILLYVGTLIRKKGVFELPLIFNEVIEKNSDTELFLVGRDSADIKTGTSSTLKLILQLFNADALKKVTWLGEKTHEEVSQIYKKASVCIFPSFAESFGLVTIESMSFGKPTVCYDYPWTREIIDNKVNGYLIEPENRAQFSDVILELIANRDLRDRIGNEARRKIQKSFDSKIIAEKNFQFYKNVINLKLT
jgi:glycosyltransferase involved in cell wall biosynthesis